MNKRGICTIFVIVTLVVLGIIGCDYIKWGAGKIATYTCKAIRPIAAQGKKQMISRWDAKRPQCIDELPIVRKCVVDTQNKLSFTSNVSMCEDIAEALAKQIAGYVAKKCEANEDKVFKDVKNMKELCQGLILLGML